VLNALSQLLIVSVGDGKELNASVLHCLHSLDDVSGNEGDVLDTSATIVLNVLLDLRLALSLGRLVDWHLDDLVEVCDNDRSE
jgi:hypothetical protein